MSKQNVDIAVLGMDRRPSYRQATPGLCKSIIGLRPTGPVNNPFWKRAKAADSLRNISGVAFTHPSKNLIVHADWHYKNDGQKRLIVILSSGSLEIIDPDNSWEVVQAVSIGDSGNYSASTSVMGDIMMVSVSVDDKPDRLYYLYQDKVIPYGFPPLPQITMAQAVNAYTQAEIDAGQHTGLRDGHYAYRYGFNVGDYTVGITPPIPFEVNNADGSFSEIDFNMVGYNQTNTPTNFDFWKELLGGIDVYISGRHETKREVLLNGLFYNVVFFDALDKQNVYQGSDNPNEQSYIGKEEDLPTYKLFDVGVEGAHTLRAKSLFSYNQRFLMGGITLDFAQPQASLDANIATGVGISAIETRTEQFPVQGDPYETYDVVYVEFTLTAFGGVLPVGEVTITPVNDVTSSSKDQVDDNNVFVSVVWDESLDPDGRGDIQFTLTAQAKDAMSGGADVGGLFSYSYPEDNQ